MLKPVHLSLGALVGAFAFWASAQAGVARCEGLTGRKVGGGVVVSAERMAAGHKLALTGPASALPLSPLSAPICRVAARLSPVPGSDINVEVWLPERWNGKLVGTGGGGFSGGLGIAPLTLNPLVAKGYAAISTDVGHAGSVDGAKWAYHHPVQMVDYGYRGNHVAALFAKALVATYYTKAARRAYFWGCSNGGRDALMEAWRFPRDYDAIVAGAPWAPATRDATAQAWNLRMLTGPPGVHLTPAKLRLISGAVMAQCDALDGVKDGVLENPLACHFDPAVLQCKRGDDGGGHCLSAAEVNAVRDIYRGPRSRNGRQISAGLAAGGEAVDWNQWITGPKAAWRQMAPEFFRWMVFGDPSWSLARFSLDRDFAAAMRRVGPILNSDNPNIGPFLEHGGTLLLYHGWADAALPPGNTIAYYEAVLRKNPEAARQVRLFMIPGMGHCFGGSGPSYVDWLGVLNRWSETGKAPERIVASEPANPIAALEGQPSKAIETRPLCAWPKQARWKGSGSTSLAASFRCGVGPK